MPAPRPTSGVLERSRTWTSQPASARNSAALRPPSEPPATSTRGPVGARIRCGSAGPGADGLDLELRLAGGGERVDRAGDAERERAGDRLLASKRAHQRGLALLEPPPLEAAYAV